MFNIKEHNIHKIVPSWKQISIYLVIVLVWNTLFLSKVNGILLAPKRYTCALHVVGSAQHIDDNNFDYACPWLTSWRIPWVDFPNVRHLEVYRSLSANVPFCLNHFAWYYEWAGRCVRHGDEAQLEIHKCVTLYGRAKHTWSTTDHICNQDISWRLNSYFSVSLALSARGCLSRSVTRQLSV